MIDAYRHLGDAGRPAANGQKGFCLVVVLVALVIAAIVVALALNAEG